MNAVLRIVAPALALLAFSRPTPAAELKLPRDGWASWQVPAVDGAPAWCCYSSWRNGKGTPMSCKLDGGTDSYGISDHDAKTDVVNVYARFAAGKVDSLQVFAASCPVESRTPIQDLGSVATEDSVRWLVALARQDGSDAVARRPIGEGALTALAMHRGDVARDALVEFTHDPRAETRKWSVFWLAMIRGNDPESEKAIGVVVHNDANDDVREHAVFALSRLPDERATRALITVAEDRSLAREQRRRAVFWLSQSESASAQAYLEKVLTRAAAN